MEKKGGVTDAQEQQDSLLTPTRMEQEKEMLVEPLKISENVEEGDGGAVQTNNENAGNSQFQANTKYLAIGGNAKMDEIRENDEMHGSLPATESTVTRTPPSDAISSSVTAVDEKNSIQLVDAGKGDCPEEATECPSSSTTLKMENEKRKPQDSIQPSIPSSPEIYSPEAKKSKTEKSNSQQKSQAGGSKKITKTIRRGRHGDPRMHRAVAARLLNPEMNLLESLLEGGFTFPNGTPSHAENVDKSDRDILDSDGILLSQRKNQLSRRLRLAKKRQLVSRPEESPDLTSGLVPPGMRLPQLQGSEIGNNASNDKSSSRALQNMLLNGRIAAAKKHIGGHPQPDPQQFRNFYPGAPAGDAFAYQNMMLNGGAPTSMPFQNTSMPMLNPSPHQLNAPTLNNPVSTSGSPGGVHQREGESRQEQQQQQQNNFLQSQGHMPGNAGSNPAASAPMFHHQQNLRGTFFPNQDRTARDDITSVAHNQPFGQEGNGWFPSQQSAQMSQQGMLPPAGPLDPQQLLQLSSMMSMGLRGNQIPNTNPNMGAPSFQGGSMPARVPINNFPPFEMNRAAPQHFLSTVDFSGRGALGQPHSANKSSLNDGVTNNMIGIQQQHQHQQQQRQEQSTMEASDEAQEKRPSSHQKTSNMWA